MSILRRSVVNIGRGGSSRLLRRRSLMLRTAVHHGRCPNYQIEPLEKRVLLSYSTLANFNGTDGANSSSTLVMDSHGNLYGTTVNGGAHNEGTIFELAAGASTVTTLYSFNALTSGDNVDGANPQDTLLIDSSGNLYGTAFAGGTDGAGTIFEYSTNSSSFTTLYSFSIPSDGATTVQPYYGALIMDSSGDLFGSSKNGGSAGHGSIFELAKNGSSYATTDTLLYSFTGGADGKNPYGGLLMDSNGDLFGTTHAGGTLGFGVLYELPFGASSTTTLYTFTDGTDGEEPYGTLIFDGSGDIIGTAQKGGADGKGSLFELPSTGSDTFSSTLTTLYSFSGSATGQYPESGPLLDSRGDLFGTLSGSGHNAEGSVYELPSGSNTLTILHAFNTTADGETPEGGLFMDGFGNLYGTTFSGGTSNDGTIYEISNDTTQLAFAAQPANTSAGTLPAINIDVEDEYGNIETGDDSDVVLSINSGPGALTGTVTVAAVNGVATFSSAAIHTAGSYTLTATDGSDTAATSNSFTVSAAAASQLIYTQQPSSATAGNNISPSIAVDIEDQYGNLVTSNSSNVILAVNSGSGTVSGTATVAASGGVATFSNLSLDTAGSHTLLASDGSLTTATSSSFNITPAAASQLVYAQAPTTVTAGQTFSPVIVVDVEDQFGNIITADNSNVILAVSSGGGTLGGTTTVAASSGVATFSTVFLDTWNAHKLQATDGSLTPATSASFTVNAASPTKWGFNVEPTNVGAGNAISPSIVVYIEDQYGNEDINATQNVTLAVNSGPGSIAGGNVTLSATNGVATFSGVTLDTAGTYTLSASGSPYTTAVSSSFTVGPAPATKLIINQQPSNVAAGAANSPAITVDVEDQFGSIVTSDTSNVVLSVNSGPGALTGTTTVAAVNGVATFSNAILDTAGNYTLTLTDGSLTSATTSSFTVHAAAAAKVAYATQPSNVTAGIADSPSIVLDVEDAFGNLVTSDSSNVVLSVHTGPGVVTGTKTVAASSGVATFNNIILDTAGAYTLNASDGSLTSANSASFTVSAAAAAKLAYAHQPTSTLAGSTLSPAVVLDVEDQFGNIVTTDSSSVVLAIDTGPTMTLNGTTTVSAVSGVATFSNLSLDITGSYSLIATDGSLTSAVSGGFTIGTVSDTNLAFVQQPSNVGAGVVESPSITVDVDDQFGNLDVHATSTVVLSINSGPGALGGTKTVAAVGGVATFSNIILDTTGTYTLVASSSGLTSADSSSFTVTPAPAAKLVYATQPSNVTAGVADSPSIVLDVEDQFGDIVTANSSSVVLSVQSGPGSITGTVTVAAVNGVATFSNAILDTVGSYTLAATDGSLTSATSTSFTVAPAAASQVAFVELPNGAGIGSPITSPAIVDVEDAFGNRVTNNTSTITLTLASGPGTLGGTDAVAAVNGQATFSQLDMATAGTYTLHAADGSLTAATSGSFTLSAFFLSKLIVVSQSNSAGQFGPTSTSVVVEAEDQFGHLLTNNNSTVTLDVPAGTVITGDLTAQLVDGYAVFNHLSISQSGTYTLSFSDGSATAARTQPVEEVASIPWKFRWWFPSVSLASPTTTITPPAAEPSVPDDASSPAPTPMADIAESQLPSDDSANIFDFSTTQSSTLQQNLLNPPPQNN